MAKPKINIVTCCTWFFNVLDNQTLSASEQLIMLHLIKFFNRNFWKPTEVSISALCRSCGKDSRTVKTALARLVTSGLISHTDKGYFLGYVEAENTTTPSLSKKTTSEPKVMPNGEITTSTDEDFNKSKIVKELKEGSLSEESKKIFNILPTEIKHKILNEIHSGNLFH